MNQSTMRAMRIVSAPKTLLIFVVVLTASGIVTDLAYAEVQLTDEQTVQIIGVGILAALFRAYLGYSKSREDFDKIKFIDGFLTASVTTIPTALGAAYTNTSMNLFGLVLIFFATIGMGLTINEMRRKSIPSNTLE